MTDKDKRIVYIEMKKRPAGRVSEQEWRRIFMLAGYTGDSDAAKFFGGRFPSMRLLSDGSRELTEHGWARS
jgi:hypothetical protein